MTNWSKYQKLKSQGKRPTFPNNIFILYKQEKINRYQTGKGYEIKMALKCEKKTQYHSLEEICK